ncbi:hypothetical protein EBQ90_02490 [bacterium]|nr:hypothetical protein [bacterium]
MVLTSGTIHAESIDDKFAQISPTQTPGVGEFVHGQGYGKILIRVLVFGSVPQQGVHYVPEGTDLLFSILYAGGYTNTSKLNGITIRRRGQKELIEVDLQDQLEDGDKVPKLQDGDIVRVPYNWRRDIDTISLITGFLAAMTGFTLSLVALSR